MRYELVFVVLMQDGRCQHSPYSCGIEFALVQSSFFAYNTILGNDNTRMAVTEIDQVHPFQICLGYFLS